MIYIADLLNEITSNSKSTKDALQKIVSIREGDKVKKIVGFIHTNNKIIIKIGDK